MMAQKLLIATIRVGEFLSWLYELISAQQLFFAVFIF